MVMSKAYWAFSSFLAIFHLALLGRSQPGTSFEMGRKRRRTTNSEIPVTLDVDLKEGNSSSDNAELIYLEESAELQQYGLPLQFGTRRPVGFDDDEAYPPIAWRNDSDIEDLERMDEDETENFPEVSRGQKRRKGKKTPRPYISTHTVFSDTMTVRELFAFHPNGLNYSIIPDSGDKAPKQLHLIFDDSGCPIVNPSTITARVQEEPIAAGDQGQTPRVPKVQDSLKKYKRQRYDLFHRFDKGILLDDAGWFSVTPESIALHSAQSLFGDLGCDVVWDAFAGVGGNAIQFALAGMHVVATELDEARIQMAQHNAQVYEVEHYIDFILADALQMDRIWRRPKEAQQQPFGAVFLSPPWGGPEYLEAETFNVETMLPLDVCKMIHVSHQMASRVSYYLPKTTDVTKLAPLLPSSDALLKIERHALDGRLKVLVVHYHYH